MRIKDLLLLKVGSVNYLKAAQQTIEEELEKYEVSTCEYERQYILSVIYKNAKILEEHYHENPTTPILRLINFKKERI